MAMRQTPLTCSGHTRPVVDLAFSGVTPYGYFLISACKGERRRRWGACCRGPWVSLPGGGALRPGGGCGPRCASAPRLVRPRVAFPRGGGVVVWREGVRAGGVRLCRGAPFAQRSAGTWRAIAAYGVSGCRKGGGRLIFLVFNERVSMGGCVGVS